MRDEFVYHFRPHQHRGFTMIELLLVISLITVLAAILLPALSMARTYSRFTLCQTNLRSQAQAHAAYSSDYDDYKPPLFVASPRFVDWVSPNTKMYDVPVGQGCLVADRYLTFDALLCPSPAMEYDNQRDRQSWATGRLSGSSYLYYWRFVTDIINPYSPSVLEGGTYENARALKHEALSADLNAEAGHHYSGDMFGRAWVNHPVVNRINIAFLDASVTSEPCNELLMYYPCGPLQQEDWFRRIHATRYQ
ncbi:MAG: type II secretion system protein [Phycisphaeraceae bacterium]|nr:type II secretion system protein [Phycisphaeraceae bacterium]